MNLEIDKVVDNGSHTVERIELNVTGTCNLHYYILADTTYSDATHISNKLRHMYWLNNQEVIAGDKVIIYTKSGTNSKTAINGGKNAQYTYYWGLGSSVWNNTGDGAILFNVNAWKAKKVV